MGFFDKFKKKTEIKKEQPIATDDNFKMQIEDVFLIKGRGVVLTGRVAQGVVHFGDTVFINNNEFKVIGIEMFRKLLDSAKKGDNIGLLINAENSSLFHRDDLILSKKVVEIKQEQTSTPNSNNNQAIQKDDILYEQFQGFAPVNGDRNNEICNKFISNGISEYSNHTFDENTLKELTFDEFCHIYSTIGWFVEKIAPNLKENAISYKKFLRKKLLSKLSTFSVYTIYATVNNLPFVAQDGSLLLYSNKKMAEITIQNSNLDWLEIFEITPELFNTAFCEYFCTGYQSVNINGQTKVKIEDVYETKSIGTYGNICVESCTRMIDYKQTQAMFISKAKEDNRNLNENEIKQLNQQSYAVSVSLLKNSLLLPAETENGMPKNISAPLVSFADGRKFIGLFTDQGAINGYYKKPISCVAFPNLISDQYKQCKDDNAISGILINPGREEYMMTKEMLSQLFTNT